MENCVCPDCFQQNESKSSLIKAVNSTHPGMEVVKLHRTNRTRFTNERSVLMDKKVSSGTAVYDKDISSLNEQVAALDATLATLCINTHCLESPIVRFCRSHAAGCNRKEYLDELLCNAARDNEATDPASMSDCVKGNCGSCGFDNRLAKTLRTCSALSSLVSFEYTEYTKAKKHSKPAELMKKAEKHSIDAYKAKIALDAVQLSNAQFGKLQKDCIEAIKASKASAHQAKCVVDEELENKGLKKSDRSSLLSLQARAQKWMDNAEKCAKAMVLRPNQEAQRRTLCSVDLPPLHPVGATKRGAYYEWKKKGFIQFLIYLRSTHFDFVMHDMIQRWQEKQKRQMEDGLQPGDVFLQLDFSAKLANIARWWTSEDSKKEKNTSILVIIAGWIDANGKKHFESFSYVSDDIEQDAVWVHFALRDLLTTLQAKRRVLSENGRVNVVRTLRFSSFLRVFIVIFFSCSAFFT
jgi:hypothetical protein